MSDRIRDIPGMSKQDIRLQCIEYMLQRGVGRCDDMIMDANKLYRFVVDHRLPRKEDE